MELSAHLPRVRQRFLTDHDRSSLRIACFVFTSLAAHALLTFVEVDASAPEPPAPQVLSFMIVDEPAEPAIEVAPEPIVEPEPEIAPEPEPEVVAVAPVRRRVRRPVHEETPPAPAEAPVAEAPPLGTVNSTDGGMATDRVAGSGEMGSTQGEVGGTGTRGIVAPAPAPAAPEPRINRRALARSYVRRVRAQIGSPAYPRAARRRHLQGTVLVGIRIDRQGNIAGVRVKESSGHSVLDAAALARYQAVDTVIAPPEELAWRTREVTLPVTFALR